MPTSGFPTTWRGEIRGLLASEPDCDGYWIRRANYFMGYRVRFSGWGGDRCYACSAATSACTKAAPITRKSRSRQDVSVYLRRRMLHYSYWSYDDYMQRLQRYTSYQAEKWYREGRRASILKLLFNMPLRFLHAYMIRGGFLDGLVGFQVCVLTGFYSFMKQARLWQLQHGRTRGQMS